jgi:DNA-binding winged helix-turn-helix (wHTH) protein/pimeloyl-ACP methyl ester carboxylesterase
LLYCFENYVLDTDRRELRRGAETISLPPQAFDLLEYLIRHRERVVSKDDLLAAVWNRRVVSNSALTTRINAARSAISDSGEEQRLIRTVQRKGFRFVGTVREQSSNAEGDAVAVEAPRASEDHGYPVPRQQVTFCKTTDGVNLAIATCGNGLPLVRTGTWLTHVEYDWQSPIWRPLFSRLAAQFRLIRYDPRGCGLSDWKAREISFETNVHDLETVVDALGLQRFAILGMSAGAPISAAFAARHPDRVSRLILSGGFSVGWRKRGTSTEIATIEALLTLIKNEWGQDNPAFRQVFSSRLFPDATIEEMQWLNDAQRVTTSAENAIRLRLADAEFDLTDLLPSVSTATLVIHSRSDAVIPFEMGLKLAHGIPNARFVALDSRNHMPLSHEPAWTRYVDEVCAFASETGKSRLRVASSLGDGGA